MRGRNWIFFGLAVFLGLGAVLLANAYFSGVEKRQERIAENQKMTGIVVATQNLGFGTPLTDQNLRMANWPANSIPVGAFTSLTDALKNSRVAVRPMVTGEPVLASKVSGSDGRATIAANLPAGKLAYAIPINDVNGVGGFVRPGDVVDVLVTRPVPGDGATANDKMTDVVLESVPVLGVDQISDESNTKPVISKTATLEVDTVGAQKLALASQLGVVSLALRNVADQAAGPRSTVIPRQLSATNYVIPAKRTGSAPAAPVQMARAQPFRLPSGSGNSSTPVVSGPSMTVIRGTKVSEYGVQRGY
ncbi:Flp pilus assembly protein CpaB [Sphingobium estronivorans]|uniref:Flp pilus assembly protein CpaB n=1 Tax=Sphingobium estronivorans TaxID=1577690 RepID=UPI00123BF332|nr:Flp pilus assembly protein CpaB [Sphingobium estronivorans]